MILPKNYKLNFIKTYSVNYQWFILYEFNFGSINLFDNSDEEILTEIIGTPILSKILYHKELENEKIELSLEVLKEETRRPFIFKNLKVSDFQYYKDSIQFKKWLNHFRAADWEDDKEDAQVLINNAEEIIWHLSKAKFANEDKKLYERHWIYIHFETFIEIDKKNKLIRTFDFGYD